jgi:hypothetical protein
MLLDAVELARAAIELRTLDLREWVNESLRRGEPLAELPAPETADPTLRTVAAALVELLASHRHEAPPGWTRGVPALERPLWLTPFAQRFPVLAQRCVEHGPEPLRRRNLYAMPDYLTVT